MWYFIKLTVVLLVQNILIQNTNSRVDYLQHVLSDDGSKLILECPCDIKKVEFLKNNKRNTYQIEGKYGEIDIDNLPQGKHSVAVFIPNKIVMFYLEINPIKRVIDKERGWVRNLDFPTLPLTDIKLDVMDLKVKRVIQNLEPTQASIFQIPKHLQSHIHTPIQWYWVQYDTDQNFSSKDKGFIAKQSSVNYLIKKNLYDIRTLTGKYNYVKVIKITDLDLWRSSERTSGFQKQIYYQTKER